MEGNSTDHQKQEDGLCAETANLQVEKNGGSNDGTDVVTPWDVQANIAKGVDYEALRSKLPSVSLKNG